MIPMQEHVLTISLKPHPHQSQIHGIGTADRQSSVDIDNSRIAKPCKRLYKYAACLIRIRSDLDFIFTRDRRQECQQAQYLSHFLNFKV